MPQLEQNLGGELYALGLVNHQGVHSWVCSGVKCGDQGSRCQAGDFVVSASYIYNSATVGKPLPSHLVSVMLWVISYPAQR